MGLAKSFVAPSERRKTHICARDKPLISVNWRRGIGKSLVNVGVLAFADCYFSRSNRPLLLYEQLRWICSPPGYAGVQVGGLNEASKRMTNEKDLKLFFK